MKKMNFNHRKVIFLFPAAMVLGPIAPSIETFPPLLLMARCRGNPACRAPEPQVMG